VKGYRNIWRCCLEPILAGQPLLGFQHRDAQQVVAEIARGFAVSRRTVQRAKNLLSGIFTVARRLGYYAEANPVSGVALPRRLPSSAETVAYSLEEVLSMLRILPLDLAAPVAVAAFAGLRQGEIRGLRRSDYDGSSLLVACSLWYKHESLPKNNSVDVVPVIRPLAEALQRYFEAYPGSPADRMFRGQHGQPLRLDTVAARRLRPLFQAHGIPWRGWHAFRRGLATTLRRLGVPIEVVARILRDKSVTVVRQHYVRMVEADSAAAMRQLEQSVQQLCNGENVKVMVN
jgi:integrase